MANVATIGPTTAPAPRDHVASVVLDGESVLWDAHTGAVHLLNPSASAVWLLLDGNSTVDEIAEAIAMASRAPRDVVVTDVVGLVRMFAGLGILVGFEPAEVEPHGP